MMLLSKVTLLFGALSVAKAAVIPENIGAMISNLCEDDNLCRDILYRNATFPSCDASNDAPCINWEGKTILTGQSSQTSLSKRDGSWWSLGTANYDDTNDAIEKWNSFANECLDTQGSNGAYSGRPSAISALSAVFMTAAVVSGVGFSVTLLSRDESSANHILYSSGAFSLEIQNHTSLYKRDSTTSYTDLIVRIDGQPMLAVNATVDSTSSYVSLNHYHKVYDSASLQKSDENLGGIADVGEGIKYNYCHPGSHHLTSQYDWDSMWSQVSDNSGNLMGSYYSHVGTIDMNDRVPGNWKQLMSTGKLILEQSRSSGSNFEDCDDSAFNQLMRFN